MSAKNLRDAWVKSFDDRKRELMEAGMTAEKADERASAEVRNEIRNSKPIPIW